MPLCSYLRLQPREEAFAHALAESGDPKGALTDLFNRFVAVAQARDAVEIIII